MILTCNCIDEAYAPCFAGEPTRCAVLYRRAAAPSLSADYQIKQSSDLCVPLLCRSKDMCILTFAAEPIHRTVFKQRAAEIPQSTVIPMWHGRKDEEENALRRNVSLLQASIGSTAAAAAASVSIDEEIKVPSFERPGFSSCMWLYC